MVERLRSHPPSTEQGGVEAEESRENIQPRDQHVSITGDKYKGGQSSWKEVFQGDRAKPGSWEMCRLWKDKEGGPFSSDSRVKGRWLEQSQIVGDQLALRNLIVFFLSPAPRSQSLSFLPGKVGLE